MEKLNKEIILETLHQNKNKIKSFGVKKIVLFGSYAKDFQNENSDIDFLVEFIDGKYNIDNHLKLLYFLEDKFNKKIDLVKPYLLREELKEEILGGIKYAAKI